MAKTHKKRIFYVHGCTIMMKTPNVRKIMYLFTILVFIENYTLEQNNRFTNWTCISSVS